MAEDNINIIKWLGIILWIFWADQIWSSVIKSVVKPIGRYWIWPPPAVFDYLLYSTKIPYSLINSRYIVYSDLTGGFWLHLFITYSLHWSHLVNFTDVYIIANDLSPFLDFCKIILFMTCKCCSFLIPLFVQLIRDPQNNNTVHFCKHKIYKYRKGKELHERRTGKHWHIYILLSICIYKYLYTH